ncbi:MAG: hypothetical protein ABI685_05230 [Ferruginibacter sp.]
MIKNALAIILFFVSSSACAQFTVTIQWEKIKPGTAGDTIYYNANRKLVWNDFKGRPDAVSPAAAITESGFGYKMSMNSLNNKTNVVITVFCYFNKKKSWVKKDMDSDYALLHEQHHYDITYINTCLFIQKLREAQFNRGNYDYLVQKLHDESFNALEKMQNEYDGETRNGRIDRLQTTWNKKIDQQLAAITN